MKYVKSKDEEYVLDDGENIFYLRGTLKEAVKEAEKACGKNKQVITVSKTVGYIDPFGD